MLMDRRIFPSQSHDPTVSGFIADTRIGGTSFAASTSMNDSMQFRAMVPASSAPTLAGLNEAGNTNIHHSRPSTAPILVPRSPGSELPPQRELPFTTKRKTTLPEVPTSRSVSAACANPATQHLASYSEDQSVLEAEPPVTAVGARSIRAEDIDTQQLLDKAAAKRSAKQKQDCTTTVNSLPNPRSQGPTAFQKRRKNTRCAYCRSKRIKCGTSEDDLEAACQPCLNAGRECSFVVNVPGVLNDRPTSIRKPGMKVPNPQLTAASLTTNIVPQEPPIEGAEQPSVLSSMVPAKRSSQLAMPAPKRAKAQEKDNEPNSPPASRSTRTTRQSYSQLKLQTLLSHRAVRELSNPPAHMQSDATTATVDTFDLDPTEKPTKTHRNSTPSRPLYSELSATAEQPQALNDECSLPQSLQQLATTSLPPLPRNKTDFPSSFAQPLADLVNLSANERNSWLDKAFVEVLQDANFIPFCKMIDERWEKHLFGFRR